MTNRAPIICPYCGKKNGDTLVNQNSRSETIKVCPKCQNRYRVTNDHGQLYCTGE